MCRRGDPAEVVASTSGRAIPDVEVRIVDADGADVAAGEPGEIVVRGYNVMRGYFNDADATDEAIDGDGLAAHRRRRGDGRGRQRAGHRPAQGHVRDRRVQRVPGRGRGGAAQPIPPSDRSPWSACPTAGWARSAWPSSCRLRGRRRRTSKRELIDWASERLANFKVPRRVVAGRGAADQCQRQGAQARAARAVRRGSHRYAPGTSR